MNFLPKTPEPSVTAEYLGVHTHPGYGEVSVRARYLLTVDDQCGWVSRYYVDCKIMGLASCQPYVSTLSVEPHSDNEDSYSEDEVINLFNDHIL